MTKIHFYKHDLPDGLSFGSSVAVDSETMGLKPYRDRLCLIQLSSGDGEAHLVQFERGKYNAPNLKKLFADPKVTKIFHYARFDLQAIKYYLDVDCLPVYCTKMASKLCRTYTDKHGLRNLVGELLNIELDKEKQSSDWGGDTLTQAQQQYAANDVLYLHQLKEILDERIAREGRTEMLAEINRFLKTRADLDRIGWPNADIFSHH